MSKILIALMILCSCSTTSSQNLQESKETSNVFIPGSFSFFELDKLGNFWLVTEESEVIKYNADGNERFRYANKRHGDLSDLDVSNPQKILAYFKDFQVAVLLDNTLSEIKTIYFEEFGYWDLQAVSISNDNQIWLFDQNEKALKKISFLGDVLLESNTIINDPVADQTIVKMREIRQKVYLNAGGKSILTFDNYGQYLESITDIKAKEFNLYNNQFTFLNQDNKLMLYKDLFLGAVPLAVDYPSQLTIDYAIMDKNLFLLTEKGILKQTLLLNKR